jgi:hypothetical protein
MKHLLILFALLSGCAAPTNHGKKLLVVESPEERQYFWEGGDECGDILGNESPYLATIWGRRQELFVRKQDAIAWVEQDCKGAQEVKP